MTAPTVPAMGTFRPHELSIAGLIVFGLAFAISVVSLMAASQRNC